MKKAYYILMLLLSVLFNVEALTPVYTSSINPDGSAQTNLLIFTPYPPGQPFYVYGTNIIFGATTLTYAPNASGFVSNNLEPITYTVIYSNSPNVGFFVKILDTTNYLPLTTYVTTLPVVAASYGSSFGFITNQLGYWPPTNSNSGIIYGLGYAPPTNTIAGLNFVYGLSPAAVPATNNDLRITLSVTNVVPTNAALPSIVNNVLADPTNYISTTDPRVVLSVTNLSSVGVVDTVNANIVTNGYTVWLSLLTNGVPGNAWTNLPMGSICTTTNGQFFVLSNLTWTVR